MNEPTSITARLAGYFRGRVRSIGRLTVVKPSASDDPDLFRKILLVAVIDSLAAIRFPQKSFGRLNRDNRRRFLRLVTDYGNWRDGSLISVPFLMDSLTKKGLAGPLSERLKKQAAPFRPDGNASIPLREMDLAAEELVPLCQCETEEQSIEECQHWSLLYRFRNRLVHEFRAPGRAMEMYADQGEPCYHGYGAYISRGRDGQITKRRGNRFHLLYPVSHFIQITESAFTGVERYYQEHGLEPEIEDTTRW